MSLTVNSVFSLLETQIGRPALIAAFGVYLSSGSATAPAPVTPVKDAADTSSSAPAAPLKAKRAKKERATDAPKREASASQAAWNAFVSQVREVIKTEPQPNLSGQVVYRVAKDIRDAGLMESCTAAQIISAYQSRLVRLDEPSSGFSKGHTKAGKKAKADSASTSSSSSVAKSLDFSEPAPAPVAVSSDAAPSKPKRQGRKKIADMTAEERAAHDAKKAAKKTPPLPSSPVLEAATPAEDISDFEPFVWKKMTLLRNFRGDVMTEDMEWFGHWDAKSSNVDTTVPKPSDLEI